MTTDALKVVLSGPPMGKERVRFVKTTGRTYTPERTLTYEARVAHAGQIAMAGRALFDGPLSLIVEAYFPIPASKPKKWKAAALAGEIRPTKKPDWDNVGKICSDALNLIAFGDDAQIVDGRTIKWFSETPRTVITVQPLKPQQGVFS